MEAEILRFEEAEPDTLPDLGLDDEIVPAIWLRLESYISRRWTARQASWIVKGPGEFRAHLSPLSGVTVDLWDDITFTWSSVICEPSPLSGFYLPRCATYRITGTLGGGTVPAAVIEAYKRLAAYSAELEASNMPPGVTSHSVEIGDGLDENFERPSNWIARAMINSGAGDLLRAFRRH